MTGRTEHVAWLVCDRAGAWAALCSCGWDRHYQSQGGAKLAAETHVEVCTGQHTPVEVRP